MKLKYGILTMIIGSFIIQYFLMSLVTTNNRDEITNTLGKVYLSSIMGLSMGVLEVIMHDVSGGHFNFRYYLPLGLFLVFFIYLYRTQGWIKDTEYLKEMIEHHSMAIFTSSEVLKKTHNYQVAKIAKNIIQKQKDEIIEIRNAIDLVEKNRENHYNGSHI
jgi:hypothetical protein